MRAFQATAEWRISALLAGWLLFGSVMISDQVVSPTTLVFGFSRLGIVGMPSVSVTLLVSSVLLSRLIRRERRRGIGGA